ncbi:MAG TPA: ATP-binding protein [Novosphingobium sp.]|nr:ATP-binding protein [Novosphingobium sp.]
MVDAQRQLSSLPMAVLLLAPGGKLASVNPAAEQLLGQSFRRLQGRVVTDVLRFEEPRIAEWLCDSEANLSARATGIMVGGQPPKAVDLSVAPLIDKPGWQVMTLTDISGSEALRDAPLAGAGGVLRAPEILAHEIKNPLAGIRGAAQLLGRKLEGKDLALAGLIADEVDRIANLIDQMQPLSSRTALELSPCNLHEAARRACAVVEAGGKAPVIAEEFDPSLPPVQGNADALVQVLINLIANAVDATAGQRDPRIAIRTRFASGLQLHTGVDGRALRLPIEVRVSDNGPGIAPDLRDHVFEPFVTSKKSGQGLGLALVRRLLRDMNGRISHERDEAKGLTHFRIHLPLAQERPKAERGEAA